MSKNNPPANPSTPPVKLVGKDLAPLVQAGAALIDALEEYNADAIDNDFRVTMPVALSRSHAGIKIAEAEGVMATYAPALKEKEGWAMAMESTPSPIARPFCKLYHLLHESYQGQGILGRIRKYPPGETQVPDARREISMLRRIVEQLKGTQPFGFTKTKTTGDQTTQEAAPPAGECAPPAKYLKNWREILDCLALKSTDENRRHVAKMNREHDGPINLPSRGGQPKVERTKLLEWWNHLEILWDTQGAGRNAKTSVESEHKHGKDETVVPEISGHVKKRRGGK